MSSSIPTAPSASSTLRWKASLVSLAALALPAALLGGCSSGAGGGGDMIGSPGEELDKPGGGTFFNEKNEGGQASALRILDMSWGRLVDVHDIDEASGETDPIPVFRDFVIDENVQSDGTSYLLETNPVTQRTRLVILREKKDDPSDEFVPLLKLASSTLSPIQPKSDAAGTPGPFSFIARNSALVVRFNDLVEDSEASVLKLSDHVKLLTNYPPTQPYVNKRMFFDPNHGGLVDGGALEFHSTRLIVDMTVSETEATSMPVPTGLNSLGLPASLVTSGAANVSVRIPSEIVPAAGQFSILTNLSGNAIATKDHGPVDFTSDTVDVVRAMRSGNSDDTNNGFLLDLNAPELLSGWPVTVLASAPKAGGTAGFDFVIDLRFESPCASQPEPGNILELPGRFLEVAAIGLPPDFSGFVPGVEVRALSEEPLGPADLLGGGLFERTFDPSLFPTSLQGCWVSFAPSPGVFPAGSISPNSQILLRFSEPMDPATVKPFDTFLVQRIDGEASPLDIVVGEVVPSSDVKEFTYTPILPFDHVQGSAEEYHIQLIEQGGITDLAGNAPVDLPEHVPFTLLAASPTQRNGGLVMRFNSLNEVIHPPSSPPTAEDIRGQFLFDPDRGVIKPRPVLRSAAIADRTQAVPALMTPFASGVQTPLSPLGSKMMTVWRYCDVGFSSQDESNYNLDVEGLNWSPIGAQVVTDVYPEFEIRLAHSRQLPDEFIDGMTLLPTKPDSGLQPDSYNVNILQDPAGPQKIVHVRELGYTVNPVDLFLSSTGTFMMPYPLNRHTSDPALHQYYTWRDTAIQAEGGPNSNGIDLMIMETAGLVPGGSAGAIAQTNQVPSLGLPLLMEFRCYPTDDGFGLNSFDISLAINTSRLPAFRIFSTGGFNTSGQTIVKDPDLEDKPDGGFNPSSTPPGKATPPDDPIFYIGQMDVISRISRVHTIWLDTEQSGGVTDFLDPVVEPTPEEQPSGTSLVFAFRGATAIGGAALGSGFAFDAAKIDPYGDVRGLTGFLAPLLSDVTYLGASNTWKADIDELDSARYIQMRITFVGNTTTLLNAELSGVGIAWSINI